MGGSDLYYFSTEFVDPNLPVKCSLVRQLPAENGRDVILIRCANSIDLYDTDLLVITAKFRDASVLHVTDEPVFVYVFDGSLFESAEEIDLSARHPILDWGGVTVSSETAEIWQVRDNRKHY